MPHYRTMTDLAAETLKEMLIVGGFTPGARLIPSELEEKLDLGRMAIREALRELIGSGLVIQQANKGICVAPPPSIEELDALFDARCALEGKIAASAAAKMDEKTLKELEGLYEIMAVPDRPAIEYFLTNRKFHITLYQVSGWRHAVVCTTHMLDQVLSYFGPRAAHAQLDFREFNAEHRLMLDAIYAKKFDEVHDMTVVNINRGRRFMASLD
jgi:DNA-binding GntR family transcriptional regulator